MTAQTPLDVTAPNVTNEEGWLSYNVSEEFDDLVWVVDKSVAIGSSTRVAVSS